MLINYGSTARNHILQLFVNGNADPNTLRKILSAPELGAFNAEFKRLLNEEVGGDDYQQVAFRLSEENARLVKKVKFLEQRKEYFQHLDKIIGDYKPPKGDDIGEAYRKELKKREAELERIDNLSKVQQVMIRDLTDRNADLEEDMQELEERIGYLERKLKEAGLREDPVDEPDETTTQEERDLVQRIQELEEERKTRSAALTTAKTGLSASKDMLKILPGNPTAESTVASFQKDVDKETEDSNRVEKDINEANVKLKQLQKTQGRTTRHSSLDSTTTTSSDGQDDKSTSTGATSKSSNTSVSAESEKKPP